MKKNLSFLLSLCLLTVLACQSAGAQQPSSNQAPSVEKIKIDVAKVGTGQKAKATVTLKNGSKTKGYVSQAGDDDFTIRDKKTDVPTTIRYADVAKVQADKGHSKARNIGLGVAIGAGAFLGILLIAFSQLNN